MAWRQRGIVRRGLICQYGIAWRSYGRLRRRCTRGGAPERFAGFVGNVGKCGSGRSWRNLGKHRCCRYGYTRVAQEGRVHCSVRLTNLACCGD